MAVHGSAIKALQQDIDYILRLMKLSFEAIICVDAEQRIVVFSEGAQRMFGYTADEAIGRSFADLIATRFRAAYEKSIRDFRASPDQARLMQMGRPLRVVAKDEREIPAESSIYKLDYGGAQTLTLVLRDATHRADTERRLRFLAEHDHLTGLPNRLLFGDRLRTAVARARRNTQSLAVLYLDLDRFKEINDRLGHAAGDAFLQQIAERLGACLRETDTIARIGGDEFAILLEEAATIADSDALLRILNRALSRPVELDGHQVRLSASIGAAFFPDDGQTPDGLMQAADRAMYRTKRLRPRRPVVEHPEAEVRVTGVLEKTHKYRA